ncbi:hypothetical protein M3Y94_00309400 [Aphelenchoides besseyi]|nr:hypothetical protein M3Y94_00309400 [Aphelenchoides besseyi]
MNASSTSTTPGNVGASTASSSSSPFGNDYMNGNNSSLHHQQRPASSSRSNTGSTSGLGNISTITTNQLASSSKNTTSPSSQMQPGTTDHLQRLAQMTDGVGGVKIEETISSNASAIAPAGGLTFDYQNAAAAYYNWTNYQHYQQFNQPMNPNAAFSGWPPSCYTPGQWQNYGQTKKKSSNLSTIPNKCIGSQIPKQFVCEQETTRRTSSANESHRSTNQNLVSKSTYESEEREKPL